MSFEKRVLPPFKGTSKATFYADCYVAMHAFFAIVFATAALFFPQLFSLFCETPIEADSLSADSIRWSSAFIYGFGFFAANSLYFDGNTRRSMAKVYSASFLIAVCSGCYIQSSGRWAPSHVLNVLLFGALGVGYMAIVLLFPYAMDRTR